MDEKYKKIELLEKEITELKERLKKYTNPDRVKEYQKRNKERVLYYAREYSKKYYENKKNNL